MRLPMVGILLLAACGANKTTTGDMATGPHSDMAAPKLQLEPEAAAQGHLTLWGYLFANGSMHTSAAGQFGTGDGSAGPCSTAQVDACVVRVCPINDAGDAASVMLTTAGAGSITITGIGAPINLPGNGTANVDRSWSGGEALSLQSAGATVPAFMIATTAPARTKVLTPAIPANPNQPVPATRSAGFPVTWQAATPGQMQIVLSSQGYTATCTVAGDKGAYTVPPPVLELAPPSVNATAAIVATATTTSGNFAIDLLAQAPAQDQGNGNLWSVTVALK